MEPDKKHVETLLKEAAMESCKSSPTPFITENAILEHLRDGQREFMDAKSARLTEEQWHALCIWRKIDLISMWLRVKWPRPWQIQGLAVKL